MSDVVSPDDQPEPAVEDTALAEPFRPFTPEQVALFEASPNPKLVLDRAFRIRYVNRAAILYGNVDRDTLVGRNVWACYPTLQGSIFHQAYQRVLDTGESAHFERYDADADLWQAVYAYPADGGVIAVLEDVTEQRRTVERLRESEGTLRLAQEAANIGSFSRNLQRGTWYWSDQLVRICGLDPDTFDQSRIGTDPSVDFVHPDDSALVRATWRTVIETGETKRLRSRIVRADGEIRYLQTSMMLVRDEDGRAARVVGTSLDITDQVRAEEERQRIDAQMQQAQKLESLGVLAGGIAHDFNNLLVGVLGNASLAMLDLEPHSPARASLAEIERAAQRAAELTRQLLAYAGKGRYVVELVEPSAVIQDMLPLMRTAIARNASLQLELQPSLPPIEVDANQFRQVVMTLVTNGSDALEDRPGVLGVHTGRQQLTAEYLAACVPGSSAVPGPYVFVEVRDTGHGMDATTRLRMFDPFFSTKFTGRGLGLAAALGIMHTHKGAIRVYSEPGAGTSVKLLFPARVAEALHNTASDDAWRASGHILIVDDDASVRAVASALLQRRGFEVSEACDGAEAVSLFSLDPHRYGLVLLDLTMPNLNGEETLRELRRIRPDVRVLLMSGYNETDVTRIFTGRTLSGFVQKPFNAGDLYAAILSALQRER